MDSDTIAIIPARYASTRISKKLLIAIHGKPLIQYTLENALKAFSKVYVATDHEDIKEAVCHPNVEVLMTPSTCANGTERIAYALSKCLPGLKAKYVVNIQADHPLITPATMQKTLETLKSSDKETVISTPVTILRKEELGQSHVVKCLVDQKGRAIYFSRAAVPYVKKQLDETPFYRHIGMYVYRQEFLLKKFLRLPPTPYQLCEDLEQLKVIEHGYKIQVAIVNCADIGVDMPEDVLTVEKLLCP